MNHQETERVKIGKIAGILGITVNILLASVKIISGILVNSMSVMADGINNVSDVASSLVTLFGFKMAEKPADREHPYGHARSEYLAGLMVSVIILMIGLELLKSSFFKIIRPEETHFSGLTLVILIISIFVKFWLMLYYRKKGEKIGSKTLIAAGEDSRNDVIATFSVLITGILERYYGIKVDGYMGLAVSTFIIYSGITLAKETVSPILGEGANASLRKELSAFVSAHEKVLGCHDLMVHDYGPNKRFASIHIEMDSREDVLESHEIIDRIERAVKKKYNIDMVIHHDPVVIGDRELDEARKIVEALLKMRDRTISIHDFRLVKEEKEKTLIFDMVLPPEIYGEADSIKESLEEALCKAFGKSFRTKITFDMDI